MTAFVEFDSAAAEALRGTLGPEATSCKDIAELRTELANNPHEYVVVLGPSVDLQAGAQLAEDMRLTRPALGVVMVRRRVDTQVLTEALRAGMRDVISEDDLAGLSQAVRRIEQLSAQVGGTPGDQGGRTRGQVITVFSAKGGSGKTSLATNLAAVLAENQAKSVALLDLDVQFGDVAISMHLAPARTLHDAVRIENLDATAIRSLMTPHPTGVSILAAPLDPAQAEHIDVPLIHRVLNLLANEYDYVIVDCPPALDDRVLAAFDASSIVALMATLDVPALKNMKLTLDTLKLIDYPIDRIRIVLNRADSKVGLSLGDVERTIGLPVAAQVPSSVDVPFAANRGVVLASESPHHNVSTAIRSFALQITTSSEQPIQGQGQSEPVAAATKRPSRWRRNS